jgi:hypothetical protein
VLDVARRAPDHVTVVLIEQAAHAINFSHPWHLAQVFTSWLDGRDFHDGPERLSGVRVIRTRRNG